MRAGRALAVVALAFLLMAPEMDALSKAAAKGGGSTLLVAPIFRPENDVLRARMIVILLLATIGILAIGMQGYMADHSSKLSRTFSAYRTQVDVSFNTRSGRKIVLTLIAAYILIIIVMFAVMDEVVLIIWRQSTWTPKMRDRYHAYRSLVVNLIAQANEDRANDLLALHKTQPTNAVLEDQSLMQRVAKPSARAVSRAAGLEAFRKDMRALEEEGDEVEQPTSPKAVKMAHLNWLVWQSQFADSMDENGMVPNDSVEVFLTTHGLSENQIRSLMGELDMNGTGRIGFRDFYRVFLSQSNNNLGTSGGNWMTSYSRQIQMMTLSLLIAAVDGSYQMLDFMVAFLFIFALCLVLIEFASGYYASGADNDPAAAISELCDKFQTILKFTAGILVTSIMFLVYFLGRRMCTRTNMKCADGSTIETNTRSLGANATMLCSHQRPYMSDVLNCHTVQPICSNARPVWDPIAFGKDAPLRAVQWSSEDRTRYKDMLARLSPPGSVPDISAFNIVDATSIVNLQGQSALYTHVVCTNEPEPATPLCKIRMPSDGHHTMEDAGPNQIDHREDFGDVSAEKDVKFVPHTASTCGSQNSDYSTIRSRPAQPDQDVEYHYPNRQLDWASATLTPTMVMDVATPAVDSTNFFYMCQRFRHPTVGNWTMHKDCLYVFAPPATCGDPECTGTDYSGGIGPGAGSGHAVTDAWYFSLITQISIGFGDISPASLRNKMTTVAHGLIMTYLGMF